MATSIPSIDERIRQIRRGPPTFNQLRFQHFMEWSVPRDHSSRNGIPYSVEIEQAENVLVHAQKNLRLLGIIEQLIDYLARDVSGRKQLAQLALEDAQANVTRWRKESEYQKSQLFIRISCKPNIVRLLNCFLEKLDTLTRDFDNMSKIMDSSTFDDLMTVRGQSPIPASNLQVMQTENLYHSQNLKRSLEILHQHYHRALYDMLNAKGDPNLRALWLSRSMVDDAVSLLKLTSTLARHVAEFTSERLNVASQCPSVKEEHIAYTYVHIGARIHQAYRLGLARLPVMTEE